MSSSFRVRLAALSIPLVALVAMAFAASARAVVSHRISHESPRSVKRFWTPKRMEEAQPLPTPVAQPQGAPQPLSHSARSGNGAGRPIYLKGQAPQKGRLAHSARRRNHSVPRNPKVKSGPVPPLFYGMPPARHNGKLYIKFGQSLYSCSATVIPSRTHTVILTAGHCIFDRRHGFADQLLFVPAYYRGKAPYGVWAGQKIVTNRQWVRHANQKYDYAAVKVGGLKGPVGSVVGESGLALNAGRHHRHELALGYPDNLGGTEIMWACVSRLLGDDPYDHGPGRKNLAIACNMSHGCSGGSWEFRRRHRYYVNSVTSYFYATKRFKNILFGPYLTKHAHRLVHRANRG